MDRGHKLETISSSTATYCLLPPLALYLPFPFFRSKHFRVYSDILSDGPCNQRFHGHHASRQLLTLLLRPKVVGSRKKDTGRGISASNSREDDAPKTVPRFQPQSDNPIRSPARLGRICTHEAWIGSSMRSSFSRRLARALANQEQPQRSFFFFFPFLILHFM